MALAEAIQLRPYRTEARDEIEQDGDLHWLPDALR